jgi:hypothetical protein
VFINGFLALGTSPSAGAFTEASNSGGTTGYARQQIAFGKAVNGVCRNAIPWTFGQSPRSFTCRAIFDAPTGGNLLMVMPFPTPLAAGRLPWDFGDVGGLRLVFSALATYPDGDAFTGNLAAATAIGTCNDSYDVVNQVGNVVPTSGTYAPVINTAVLYSGVALTITRGVLAG